jgi:hypothetical protein
MQTIPFTRRQVALTLGIIMQGEQIERLAKTTNTAVDDLRRIAAGELPPTAGVSSFLNLHPNGKGAFVWDVR